MFKPFAKWPVLLGAAFCIGVGAVLIRDVPNGNIVTGLMLVALGSLLLGVFIVLYVLDVLEHMRSPPDDLTGPP
jgi:drug/metabolite transporter (DMT)-like permease